MGGVKMDDEEVKVRGKFSFRPMNGYIVITEERDSTGHAQSGRVVSVSKDLEEEVRVGDVVLYSLSDVNSRYISFGKVAGLLVNVKELYGFWDTEKVERIFEAQGERIGYGGGRKVSRGIEFVEEAKV